MGHPLLLATFAFLTAGRLFAGGPDLEVSSLDIHGSTPIGDNTITGTVTNTGTTAVQGFTLTYAIDGVPAVAQAFTATIPVGGSYVYSFNTPWNAVAGDHTVSVTVSQVEGDAQAGNDTFTTTTKALGGGTPRTTVIEEFTSSTCVPCASFNETFDPLLNDLGTNTFGSRVAAVKYQMNWPPPGNDPSYNPNGSSRRSFYSVESIPTAFIDGEELVQGTAGEINGHVNTPSVVMLDVSYERNGNTITATAHMTPLVDLGSGCKLHMVVTENFYHYAASTTTQDDFHYAMRRMLPNAGGTPLISPTAGEEVVVTESYDLIEGGAAQGNYNLWGTIDGITVVAFVQKTVGREIYQGAIATSPVGVEENSNETLMGLYPNPTNGQVYFSYAKTANVRIAVVNALGETVLRTDRGLNAGQVTGLDLSAFGNGLYFVNVTANGVRSTGRVMLER